MKSKYKLPGSGSRARLSAIACSVGAVMIVASCSKVPSPDENRPAPAASESGVSAGVTPAASEIISKYESTDRSKDSTTRLKASVERQDASSPEIVQLTIYRKKEPDGTEHYLVDFTAPAQERDRDALINVSPAGEIEAIRYAQSTGGFITARSATDEESMFGLTLQELVGGQPEKYDYKLIGEESHAGMPVYRLEGSLKPGAESRFTRTIMLISKENYTAPVIEAYDNQGQLARKLVVGKMEQVSGNWMKWQWTVDNQEQRKKVGFQVIDAKVNQNLPESMFARDYLKKSTAK
jgi:hypothetical protein